MERVCIIIDGNNFYHKLKENELIRLLGFDYNKFADFLLNNRKLVYKKYYIGSVREERGNLKSRKLMSNQRKLLGRLKRDGWDLGLGYMLKTDVYHEKGVDVLMAVDILIGAYEDLYDTVILISSDTDLLPAMNKVREMGKKIEYIGFSKKPSLAMITNSDERRLLIKQELERFIN